MKQLIFSLLLTILFLSAGLACDDSQRTELPAVNVDQTAVQRVHLENAQVHERAGRLQEASWEYSWAGEEQKAQALKTQLTRNMRRRPIRIKFLGSGSSMSFKLYFEDGSKALFKINDPEIAEESEVNAELAAYGVEQQLNLNIMPMVVARSVNIPADIIPEEERHRFSGGRVRGVASYWVDDVSSPNLHNLERIPKDMKFFDQLIINTDRGMRNYLERNENNQIVAIDHDRSFVSARQLRELGVNSDRPHHPSPVVLERLRETPPRQWRRILSPHISDDRIEEFLARRAFFLGETPENQAPLIFSN